MAIAKHFTTDINNGLSADQVQSRIDSGLVNGDFNIPSKSVKQILKDNCFTFFNLINIVLAAFVVAVGSFKNCLFLGIILCNTAIGIFQEIRSKRAVDKLALISAPKASVLRDGSVHTVAVKDVVMDELMILDAGKQVCADCVVLEGECEVNESLITGESDPVIKKQGDELLSGSFIICGNIKAQAVRIGADSYANKITSGAKYIKKNNSEMLKSINNVLKIISVCIVPMILLMFCKELFITKSVFADAVVNTVSAIIGMIPEGLVLMASMVMAVSVVRLAMKKTLAQDLYCVETLARVDVLCLDKTGTITEGKMEVTELISLDGNAHDSDLTAMVNALDDRNPTYEAIKERYGGDTDKKAIYTVPFSSEKKRSMAVFNDGTYILGAAEFILSEVPDEISRILKENAAGGYRLILLAHSDYILTKGKDLPQNAAVTPLAIVKISDKIRKDAPETLEYFAKQGVDIRIISGDSPDTVSGIAQRAGLADYDSYVDASTLENDEQVWQAAGEYKIFGRVTPHQKLELVKALKAKGHTVAMTGDGVNDVLALKEADCSIAMQSGSDAARNVSNIVLLDSSFSSMPEIVAEGRRSINNIERSGVLFLYKTVYSFLVAMLFCFVPMAYPLQAIQLTQINIFTNGIPSFLLAMEPNFRIVKGKFIENVLPKSVIYGLLITLNFVLIVIARYICKFTEIIPVDIFDTGVETLGTIAVGFAAFVVLFRICVPIKGWKLGMIICLAGGFTADLFLLKTLLLDLHPMDWRMTILLAILMGVSVVYGIFASLFEQKLERVVLKIQRKVSRILVKRKEA